MNETGSRSRSNSSLDIDNVDSQLDNKNKPKHSVSLTINKKQLFADVVFKGKVTQDVLNKTFLDLVSHPDFERNLNACYDYSQAYAGMEMAEIENHADFVANNLDKRGDSYKLALVSDDTLNLALLNVYKLLIAKTPVEAEVFNDKTKAVDWIIKTEY